MEIIGPALLLGPQLSIVSFGVDLELELVGVDNLLAAVLALDKLIAVPFSLEKQETLTIEVGLGALTGRPLALTGARVPAASAFLCSLVLCKNRSDQVLVSETQNTYAVLL